MTDYHLGVHYGHNATIAVVREGELIFCQSEERLNRIKNSTGFPHLTLHYVHENVCVPEDISSATLFGESIFGYLFLKQHDFKSIQYGDYLSPDVKASGLFARSELRWKLSQWRARNIKDRNSALLNESMEYFSKALGLPANRIHAVKHHYSHAYSAVPNIQGWPQGLVFTLDGVGDWVCATVSRWDGQRLHLLQKTDHHNSLGYIYSATTAIMGMRSGEHEFKVMGLAPYANRGYYKDMVSKLRRLLFLNADGQFVARVPPTAFAHELEKIYRFQRFDNIAGAVQELTEQLIQDWVQFWISKTGIHNIAVAGGVFMNVKACQKLLASPEIEKMYVVPSAADESTAIGAAFATSRRLRPDVPLKPVQDLYLGRAFSEEEILDCLTKTRANERYIVSRPDNINHAAAALLAENKVVARFDGRMEFGARALGNRSILANPSSFQNIELINSAIKSRDFWMPFTPSILEEDMARYIVNHDRIYAPYMCITFDTTAEARRDLPAAIHPRDKTARPQSVSPAWNPGYHALIAEFKRLTGIGAVLNTSFNLHGEPNVCSPDDALHTLDCSGLQYLAMGPFLLSKNV